MNYKENKQVLLALFITTIMMATTVFTFGQTTINPDTVCANAIGEQYFVTNTPTSIGSNASLDNSIHSLKLPIAHSQCFIPDSTSSNAQLAATSFKVHASSSSPVITIQNTVSNTHDLPSPIELQIS